MNCPPERKIARTSRGEDVYAYIDRDGIEQFFVVPPGHRYVCENQKWEVYMDIERPYIAP
jgi:hypothetical protein